MFLFKLNCQRFALATCLMLPFAFALEAAEVGFFRLDSREEMIQGEADGTAVGPLGQIELGFALERLTSFEEPFLLSAAAIPGGGFLIGTGNDGNVWRVDAAGAKSLLGRAGEGQVFSVYARRDGSLLAAGSPKAKIYRLQDGKAEEIFDPAATYVWAMTEDAAGRLLVATGLPGRVYRLDEKGHAEVLYEGAEPHVRSLLALPDGDLIFGSAGQGLVLRRSEKGGKARIETLYDAAEPEVAALTLAPDGRIFAALLASEASQVDLAAGAADAAATDAAEPAVIGTRAGKATGPRSVVVEIRDRAVTKLFELQDETLHSLLFAAGQLWAGTGQEGHLYRYRDEVLVREASLEEKQVVALLPAGAGLALATTDAAALYALPGTRRQQGSFTTPPLDAKEIAAFGLLRAEGRYEAAGDFSFAARSGATESPDPTWTAWQDLPAAAAEPAGFSLAAVSPGRYVQVRATLRGSLGKGGATPRLDALELSYRQENRAPRIDKLEVLAPGEILVPVGFNPTTTTFEPWSPNKEGIFTSIKGEEEKGEGRLKSLFKKGYRTLKWSASDSNGDKLLYSLEVQAIAGKEGMTEEAAEATTETVPGKWLTMVSELDDDHFSFDATVLPDGRYRFRLRADDGSQRAAGLAASRISEPVQIDHSAPRFKVLQGRKEGAGRRVEVELEDASPLREVVLSIDGGEWRRLEALDGLLDGRREKVAFVVPEAARFVVVRVTDAAFNVLTFPIEPR